VISLHDRLRRFDRKIPCDAATTPLSGLAWHCCQQVGGSWRRSGSKTAFRRHYNINSARMPPAGDETRSIQLSPGDPDAAGRGPHHHMAEKVRAGRRRWNGMPGDGTAPHEPSSRRAARTKADRFSSPGIPQSSGSETVRPRSVTGTRRTPGSSAPTVPRGDRPASVRDQSDGLPSTGTFGKYS